ncbi:MAG: BMC domain-containing protein [Candidatus Latescibacteria bacterium]|nr:BMC domain-containing protein [Candidatus Latescibacterota bacterium]
MKRTAIGLIELSSIAAGFAVADVLLKAAMVELLINRTICSGKYLILIGGEVAAVEASLAAGVGVGGSAPTAPNCAPATCWATRWSPTR